MIRAVTTLILIALAASPALAKRDRSVPEARQTGTEVSCIQTNQIRESRVRSDQVIDFRVGANKWYRNTLPHSCPSLGFEERFAYRTSTSQLCSVDIITVLQTAGGIHHGASCGLGPFVPVEIAKRK